MSHILRLFQPRANTNKALQVMIWEYLSVWINERVYDEDLKRLGEDRWEMCGIHGNFAYFKRPLLR